MLHRFLFVLVLVCLSTTAADAGSFHRTTGEQIPGRYLVVFEEGHPAAQVALAFANRYGARVGDVWTHAVNGALFLDLTPARAEALARHPAVAWVEEDAVASVDPVPALQPEGPTFSAKTWIYQYSPPWGLDRIDERDLPLNGVYTYDDSNSDGGAVEAYVIDTGIRITHNEFGGRAYHGYDSIGDGQNGNDCHGHGTHVAGTIGGATYGVAKAVNLYAVRVLDCGGYGSTSTIVAGVNWVTGQASTRAVANMSIGHPPSTTIDNAVTNSVNSGVFYAVSAGNDNADACGQSPARAAAAFAVAATNSSDTRASFSNYGSCVDLFAPGESVTSAWHTSNSATYTTSGTSMAAPHVAGAAARIIDELNIPVLKRAVAKKVALPVPTRVRNELLASATCGQVADEAGSPDLLLYRPGSGHRMEARVEAFTFGGRRANLYWGGSCVSQVDVFRDGVKVATTANDGTHLDYIGGTGSGSFNYWVCEAGSTSWYETETCSNVVTAYF